MELLEVWVLRDGRIVAEGDALQIRGLLEASLIQMAVHPIAGARRTLYRHKQTGRLWELTTLKVSFTVVGHVA